jgi:hypothetical protein
LGFPIRAIAKHNFRLFPPLKVDALKSENFSKSQHCFRNVF